MSMSWISYQNTEEPGFFAKPYSATLTSIPYIIQHVYGHVYHDVYMPCIMLYGFTQVELVSMFIPIILRNLNQ